MAARSRTQPSTRRLSEVARHLVIPTGIVTSGWAPVEAQCRELGDEFDEWQRGLGQVMLGKREDGKYAATVGGITLSIPRQVAKTFIVGRVIFALCILFPGLRVLWTAHHTATLSNTFRSLSGYARRKKVAPHIGDPDTGGSGIRRGSGKEAILFRNGSAIYFGAREQGFGRGFDEVDVEVFDEAQILTEKALEDMVAATNQSRHPHGALLFYMGTPPRPSDPGEAFTARRDDALRHKSGTDFGEPTIHGHAVYVECSADPNVGQPHGPSLDDREQLRKANPSYPHRTPQESVDRLRANLKSDDSWRREGLGVWDELVSAKATITKAKWTDRHVEVVPREGKAGYAVKFSADGARVALAVARFNAANETIHVEVVKVATLAAGTGWLEDWLTDRVRGSAGVVIDGKSGQGPLVTALRNRRVPERLILTPSVDWVIAAHAGLLSAVNAKTLTHYGQTGLDSVVERATKRPIGKAGGWGWQGIGDDVDVTPLDAVTLAHHMVATSKRKATREGDGRRGVVLG